MIITSNNHVHFLPLGENFDPAYYIFNKREREPFCELYNVVHGEAVKYEISNGKAGGTSCANDDARSVTICEGKRGTKLTVYDDGECRKNADDWAEITINTNFLGCILVSTFEADAFYGDNNEIYANYGTSDNLNGKVSCLNFEL